MGLVETVLLWTACVVCGSLFARWWYDHRRPHCRYPACKTRVLVHGGLCYEHSWKPISTSSATFSLTPVAINTALPEPVVVPTLETVEEFSALFTRVMQWAPHLSGCATEANDPCDCGWEALRDDFMALKKKVNALERVEHLHLEEAHLEACTCGVCKPS